MLTTFSRLWSQGRPPIAIVGASIAGLLANLVLREQGFSTTLFEKKSEPHVSMGNAVVIPDDAANFLVRHGVVHPSMFYSITDRPLYYWDSFRKKETLLTTHPISGNTLSWSSLYHGLLDNSKGSPIKFGEPVISYQELEDGVQLRTPHSQHQFGFCVFADGLWSNGQSDSKSNSKPRPLPYCIWRGLKPVTDSDLISLLSPGLARYYVFDHGHLLLYLVKNETHETDFLLNWALYVGDRKLTLQCSVPGLFNKSQVNKSTADLLHRICPPKIARFLSEPHSVSRHDLYERDCQQYASKRLIRIGDAASVLRPHTVSGVAQAVQDAAQLSSFFDAQGVLLPDAVARWSEERAHRVQQLIALGRRIGDFFVENPPDWPTMTAAEIDREWGRVTTGSWYFSTTQSKVNTP